MMLMTRCTSGLPIKLYQLATSSRYTLRTALLATTLLMGCTTSPTNQQFKTPIYDGEATTRANTAEWTSLPPVPLANTSVPATTNHQPPTPWLDTIQSTFLHARSLVEQELSIDLGATRLLVVSDSPINKEVRRETSRLVHAQFGNTDFTQHFLERVMAAQAGTYAALYTSRLKSIMVSREMLASYQQSLPNDAQVQQAALLTLLIHELVHAADDKRFQINKNRALNFRASFAQSATFEGHAQWVTRKICQVEQCNVGLTALDDFMFNRTPSTHQALQPVEAISRNVLEYSYIEGERFIEGLAKRPNGRTMINQVLLNPPYDPIEILAPQNYPNTNRDRLNQRLIDASLDIDHPWVKAQWIGVETSPLKGVNLRADPDRRQSAIDGFTRLIDGMVAMQLYDRGDPDRNPLEVTVFKAESAYTASLFARTLHQNSQVFDAQYHDEAVKIRVGAGNTKSSMKAHIYRTVIAASMPFHTNTLLSGPYVVQITGQTAESQLLDDYLIRTMLNLQLGSINAESTR